MMDKITTIPKVKIAGRVGRLADEDGGLNRAVLVFLGIAAPASSEQTGIVVHRPQAASRLPVCSANSSRFLSATLRREESLTWNQGRRVCSVSPLFTRADQGVVVQA